MSDDVQGMAKPVPQMSSYCSPVGELIASRLLSPPLRPGVLATLDGLEILSILGSGGMGIVLQARDPDSDKDFAIKMIKPELMGDQQVVHRFVKEAGHMHRLSHANVMPVTDVSERPQGPYYVMPYFERGSLAKCIQPGRALEPAFVLEIASQIAAGLRYTHQHGIIHRDLKPANILLAADDRICLADFGLARTMFNDTIVDVESQQCEGTAPYMSPAVAAGEAEDTRCDIYAFGALLYEMLTGQPPYKGRTTKEFRKQILAGPPRPIATLNPKADSRLIAVAEGAMARELRDRYAVMADIVADLARIKDGKAPLGPRGLGRKARQKLERIRRIPKLVRVLACLAGLVGLGFLVWSAAQREPLIFRAPQGIAVDSVGNVYVADGDYCTISKISPSSVVSTLAGTIARPGIVNGAGTNARFTILRGAAVDSSGNVYVTDSCIVRRITPSGAVSTFAGKAGVPGFADGNGGKARFGMPCGITVDTAGNLFVADMYTIRKITPVGFVSTLAGTVRHPGSADGPGVSARFGDLGKGLAVDNAGNILVADAANNSIRRITPAGTVSTFAGVVGQSGSADGVTSKARFWHPQGIAVDRAGNVYVADTANNTIRRITPPGAVDTLAGLAGESGNVDGVGSNARFSHPQAVSVDAQANLYVADMGNQTIRKVTPNGHVSTLSAHKIALHLPALSR